MGENGPKTHFVPTLNPSREIDKNPLFAQFKGVATRALRQSRPSITIEQLLCTLASAWRNWLSLKTAWLIAHALHKICRSCFSLRAFVLGNQAHDTSPSLNDTILGYMPEMFWQLFPSKLPPKQPRIAQNCQSPVINYCQNHEKECKIRFVVQVHVVYVGTRMHM